MTIPTIPKRTDLVEVKKQLEVAFELMVGATNTIVALRKQLDDKDTEISRLKTQLDQHAQQEVNLGSSIARMDQAIEDLKGILPPSLPS